MRDSALKRRVLRLAKDCQPVPGTPISEVHKIWDIQVGHNAEMYTYWRGIQIKLDDRMPAREVHLRVQTDINTQGPDHYIDQEHYRVLTSSLVLEALGPSSVWIDSSVLLPKPWDEETYLNQCVEWLQCLKKTIDERKKNLPSLSNKHLQPTPR